MKLLILILRLFWSEDLTRLRLTSPHGWWHRSFQAFLEQMLLRKQIKIWCHMLQLVLSENPLKRKTLSFKFIFFQVMIPQQHFHSVSWYWFDKHKVALVLFTCNYTRKWTFNASTIFASHFSFVLLVLKMSCWHISASLWEKLKKKFFIFKVQQWWSVWSRTCLVIQKCQKWKYFLKHCLYISLLTPWIIISITV